MTSYCDVREFEVLQVEDRRPIGLTYDTFNTFAAGVIVWANHINFTNVVIKLANVVVKLANVVVKASAMSLSYSSSDTPLGFSPLRLAILTLTTIPTLLQHSHTQILC
ncbi:hypothetical protein M8J75_003568 [Diaphorina citri]|nr:hypothetical protein M8J75_003568 [Diaphorina citri]